MRAVLRRSRGLVIGAVAAGALAVGAQPAHATNPRPACGAWFHAWQYWTNIWQTEAIRLNADSVSDLEWYAIGQANDNYDKLISYNCTIP